MMPRIGKTGKFQKLSSTHVLQSQPIYIDASSTRVLISQQRREFVGMGIPEVSRQND